MKKTLFLLVACASLLPSCALIERDPEEFSEPSPQAEAGERLFRPDEQGEKALADETYASWEAEVSRLNTKVAALETKIDVLSANLEKGQLQSSQPIIEAQPMLPQANLAAPVEEGEEPSPQVSAAPVRPVALSEESKGGPELDSAVEKEFRSVMQVFQGGRNLDAASRFATFAKKYPRHLLASHALYWGGEAAARAQQWSIAIQNWEELEKLYPRSAYLPEALSGLAQAHQTQGDVAKGKSYQDNLLRAFPKSPVALTSTSAAPKTSRTANNPPSNPVEEIPSYGETDSEVTE